LKKLIPDKKMIQIDTFIENFPACFQRDIQPWELTNSLKEVIKKIISDLGDDFEIRDEIAVHKTAMIENGAIIKSPAIVSRNCFVGANAYFREGVFLSDSVKIGAGCEIKSSIICSETAIAHFNYIGNSIIGSNVNFEAGSIAANHYNEREAKMISVLYRSQIIETKTQKFGALVGDNSKIGANAVLSPGTILEKRSIVKRLELVEQLKFD
jgi:NDP-sugar pyrophosphorylase family protein